MSLNTRRSPVATSSKKATPITDKRRKWYSVLLLAAQSSRSVDEIVGWIEAGELKGFLGRSGWVVHRDQLDVWRELCKRPVAPAAEPKVFTSMAELLMTHPELRLIQEEMSAAIFAKPSYDKARHEAAKQRWDEVLEQLGISLVTRKPSLGFGGSYVVPDPDEPGFQPIDINTAAPWTEEQA